MDDIKAGFKNPGLPLNIWVHLVQTIGLELGSLIDLYDQNEEIRSSVRWNVEILKCIRGGLRMSEKHRISFDPRAEYWYPPERRFLVAYFAERWTGHFAPARALRSLALHAFSHFDQARTNGTVSYRGVKYESSGGLKNLCAALAEHARKLSTIPEWNQLRSQWPDVLETAGEDIARFLLAIKDDDKWEGGFKRRLPWFGYLGAQSEEDLRSRQAFFFGYANLWTTTNAYVRAGAQAFAPIIQNTKSEQMLDSALQWATGTNPITTAFLTLGKDDDQAQDRSLHACVVEVYGFLNLERGPFYNNRAELYRKWFNIDDHVNAYELTSEVGKVTAAWLNQNSAAEGRLANLFHELINQPFTTRVELESIHSPKVRKKISPISNELLDSHLFEELGSLAQSELGKLGANDAARSMMHLLLDGKLYFETSRAPNGPIVISVPKPEEPVQVATTNVGDTPSPANRLSSTRNLPQPLRRYGERALAYLTAGFHVLFAGAPGTGKTTLAQFVGHAWDNDLKILPDHIATAPLTTVGNSAWSPFHTIGGLMPTGDGKITTHRGLFIDPEGATETAKEWRLRSGAVVLDEMNRADLDRCIGELYPLLSGSVEWVTPAGLPGVESIRSSDRFRVLATVNDSRLDDIVFPISEGLARRFLRIELPGASSDEVLGYLGLDAKQTPQEERRAAAQEAVVAFFERARTDKLLSKDEDDDRLPFGVAYFKLLKTWMDGPLNTSLIETTLPEKQARELLVDSLRALRGGAWRKLLRTFVANG